MVISKPFKVLVCLFLVGSLTLIGYGWGYATTVGRPFPGVQSDALSADPGQKPIRHQSPQPRQHTKPLVNVQAPRYTAAPSAISKCRPYSCGHASCAQPLPSLVPPIVPPLVGMFALPGFPFLPATCNAVLPRPACKQFHFSASLWWAKLTNSTIVWGTNGTGSVGTELDLHRDLKLALHPNIAEYEGSYQMRPNWAIRYSFIPMHNDERGIVDTPGGFYFGGSFFAEGTPIHSRWDRNIHRFEVVYSWFSQRHAVSSIVAGYHLYDDRLIVTNDTTTLGQVRSQGFGLASAGLTVERVISDVGQGGGTASIHCKWTMQFLEGYFGWDGLSMARLAVPMNCGRWGYLEAGWRWMRLETGPPTRTDRSGFEGITASVGMIF